MASSQDHLRPPPDRTFVAPDRVQIGPGSLSCVVCPAAVPSSVSHRAGSSADRSAYRRSIAFDPAAPARPWPWQAVRV